MYISDVMGLNKLNRVWTLPSRRFQETKEDRTDTQVILTEEKGQDRDHERHLIKRLRKDRGGEM